MADTTYVPRYTTWERVQARAATLLKDETADTLLPFIEAAENWVDNRLLTVYRMPLTFVDPIVVTIVTTKAVALAVMDHFANRGREEVTLAGDLNREAENDLTFCITNTTLKAELIPRPTSEARPMVASTTLHKSAMPALLDQAFAYRGGSGWPRR